jgi:hypothetical protein
LRLVSGLLVIRQESARKGHMFSSSSVRAVVLMFKGDAAQNLAWAIQKHS